MRSTSVRETVKNVSDLEEDELRDDGDDLALFGAEEQRLPIEALFLVSLHEEGNEHVGVDDYMTQVRPVLGVCGLRRSRRRRRRNCS